MMRKLILTFLILICFVSASSYAKCDFIGSILDWNFYYYQFGISGYPVYNALLERYDFYDIDDNYRGSLSYNPLLSEWEYFGL